jgi:hypothetical protein
MRVAAILLGLLLGAVPAVPAAAQYNQAPREPRECTRLTRQILRYEGDIQRARERGNELWESAMEQQVERLDARRIERCPQYAKDERWKKLFAKAIDVASDAAWKNFTWNY